MPSAGPGNLARPRGPLDGRDLPRGADFSVAATPAAARFLLRGDGEVAALASTMFGVLPPQQLGPASVADVRAALWLGPDEWLLIAEGEAAPSLGESLEVVLSVRPHSLVDVSQRQIGLNVSGAVAARALSAGCPLDLRDRAFPVGFATRTMLAKTEIVLWRRGASRFQVEVWRSFADYAASFLIEAARRAPRPNQ